MAPTASGSAASAPSGAAGASTSGAATPAGQAAAAAHAAAGHGGAPQVELDEAAAAAALLQAGWGGAAGFPGLLGVLPANLFGAHGVAGAGAAFAPGFPGFAGRQPAAPAAAHPAAAPGTASGSATGTAAPAAAASTSAPAQAQAQGHGMDNAAAAATAAALGGMAFTPYYNPVVGGVYQAAYSAALAALAVAYVPMFIPAYGQVLVFAMVLYQHYTWHRFLALLIGGLPGWGAVTEVHNGRELALAFANNSVTTILMASDIHLLEADWVGLPSPVPVVLTRDITVVSQPGLSYLIDFNYISRKMRLGNGTTLRFINTAVTQNRLRVVLSPGLDLLEPCLPGERATFINEGGILLADMCYPQQLRNQNYQGLTRSPNYPGTNKLLPVTPQTGCVNSTSVPRPQQCYPETGMIIDVAVEATELSALGGATVPSNYLVRVVNTSLACLSLLSNDCIAQYTLPGCRQLVLNARKASADAEARGEAPPGGTSAVGGSPWDPQGTPADPTAAPQGPAGGGGGGGGGSESGTPWWLPQQQLKAARDSSVHSSGRPAAASPQLEPGADQRPSQDQSQGGGMWRWLRRAHQGAGGSSGQQPLVLGNSGGPGGDMDRDGGRARSGSSEKAGGPAAVAAANMARLQHAQPAASATELNNSTSTSSGPTVCVTINSAVPSSAVWVPGAATVPRSLLESDLRQATFSAISNLAYGDGNAVAKAAYEAAGAAAGRTDSSGLLSPFTPARTDLQRVELSSGRQRQQQPPRDTKADSNGSSQTTRRLSREAREQGTLPDGGKAAAAPGSAAAATTGNNDELKLLPGEPLGRGAVYRGMFRGQLVAVKMLGHVGLLNAAQQQQQLVPQPPRGQQPPPHQQAGSEAPAQQQQAAVVPQLPLPPSVSGAAHPQHPSTPDICSPTYISTSATEPPCSSGANACERNALGETPGEAQQGSPARHAAALLQQHRSQEERQPQQQEAEEQQRDGAARSSSREGLMRTLQQEVDCLARCKHPCIVRLLAVCAEPPLMVMELMDTSLDRLQYGRRGGAAATSLLPLSLVLHIGIEVARGLAYMHPNLAHRDLKPANVLISQPDSERPIVKIADFGLSRLLDTAVITRNPDAGTPPYMAPECLDLGNRVAITHKVDVFALAVMLAEMLARQHEPMSPSYEVG
eukprot:XP_001690994.1 predicted protein [Chlamydomonas reinhardtii]